MPARSLVQALEGVQFPCDRAWLMEYARRQEVGQRSLEALEAIPDREYRNLNELFSALPSKSEMRRATMVRGEQETMEAGRKAQESQQQDSQQQETDEVINPMEATMQLWLCGMQVWPEWVRLSQRLWFPWIRER